MQIVEFDVDGGQSVIGVPLRQAEIPPDSKVASIIRGDSIVVPRGDETIEQGDRIIVIGSPEAAQAWSKIIAPAGRRVEDVVIYGAGRAGLSIGAHPRRAGHPSPDRRGRPRAGP